MVVKFGVMHPIFKISTYSKYISERPTRVIYLSYHNDFLPFWSRPKLSNTSCNNQIYDNFRVGKTNDGNYSIKFGYHSI